MHHGYGCGCDYDMRSMIMPEVAAWHEHSMTSLYNLQPLRDTFSVNNRAILGGVSLLNSKSDVPMLAGAQPAEASLSKTKMSFIHTCFDLSGRGTDTDSNSPKKVSSYEGYLALVVT